MPHTADPSTDPSTANQPDRPADAGRPLAVGVPVWIWFGRPITPWPNWAQLQLPIGPGYGQTQADVDRLTATHDPDLNVDELPGTLHHWSRLEPNTETPLGGTAEPIWFGHVSFRPPVHGEGISLSAYLDWFPAARLRPRPPI